MLRLKSLGTGTILAQEGNFVGTGRIEGCGYGIGR
jgi:hypothetical protein